MKITFQVIRKVLNLLHIVKVEGFDEVKSVTLRKMMYL